MKKQIVVLMALLLAVSLLLSAASSETALTFGEAYELAGQGKQMDLLAVSPKPDDFSDFEILVCSDLADAVKALIQQESVPGEDGASCVFAISEETAQALFESAVPLSLGPDGSILYQSSAGNEGLLFVQRDRVLTPLLQASDRGVPDEWGHLKDVLFKKLNIMTSAIDGDVRWSPDGRYLFLNDRGWWRLSFLENPTLADTRTGEIFLLEASPSKAIDDLSRFILSGCFSRNGRYFDYLVRDRAGSSGTVSVLMRYDLETGACETVWETQELVSDFCEMGENHWLMFSGGSLPHFLRVGITEDGIIAEQEDIPFSARGYRLFPVNEDLAMIVADVGSNMASFMLPVRWESTGSWMVIPAPENGEPVTLTAEEAAGVIRDAYEATYGGNGITTVPDNMYWPDIAYISSICAIESSPLVMIPVRIANSVPENWPHRVRYTAAMILLNTETMQYHTAYQQSLFKAFFSDVHDETLWNDRMLQACMVPAGPEKEIPEGERHFTTPAGDYKLERQGNVAVLYPWQSLFGPLGLKYTDLSTTVTGSENLYRIRSVFTRYPEPETLFYLVPEALPEERYQQIASGMNGKDKKKFVHVYKKVDAGSKEAQELLEYYPQLAYETMYILNDELTKLTLEMADELLKKYGYTEADFEQDSFWTVVSRGLNQRRDYDPHTPKARDFISCSFPDVSGMSLSRLLQLANLCDRINSAVYLQVVRPEGEPAEISGIVPDTVEMEGTVWHITLDSAEDTGEQLTLSMTFMCD